MPRGLIIPIEIPEGIEDETGRYAQCPLLLDQIKAAWTAVKGNVKKVAKHLLDECKVKRTTAALEKYMKELVKDGTLTDYQGLATFNVPFPSRSCCPLLLSGFFSPSFLF
jgi:hypothetical protein